MNELQVACAQVWRYLDPASAACLLEGMERSATPEGKSQRRLIAVARQLTLEARRMSVLPASAARPVLIGEMGSGGVPLRPEWQGFGDAVRQLHRALYRDATG
ncbi:MAG: hypothetical protein ABW005_00605 [Burkholderiaceae bacterium]